MRFWNEFDETNENEGHPQSPFTLTSLSSKKKKKILGARDPNTHLEETPKEKSVIQEIHPLRIHSISASSRSVPYDPVNNFTSPRPAFLRYNPDRRKEILLRMRDEEGSVADSEISQDQEKSAEEDSMSVASTSPKPSFPDEETHEEEEVEERRPWCLRTVWKLLLLFGVFLFSYCYLFPMSSPSPFHENILSTENLMYVGLSDVCLDIGEGMCDLVVPDDSVTEHLGDSVKNESLIPDEIDGVLDLNERKEVEVEVVAEKARIFMDDEVDGVLDSDEEESIDEVQVVAEKDAIFLYEVNGEMLKVEERREEPVSSFESLEQEEILGDQAIENLSESVEAPDDQFVSDEALIETNSRGGEAEDDESVELTQPSLTVQFESVPSLLQDDQAAKESELLTVNETSSRWKLGFEYASKDVQLLLASLSSLAVITGLLIGMFKCFARCHQKSSLTSSPSLIFLPSDMPVDEKRMGTASNVNSLIHSNYEHKEPVLVSMTGGLRAEGKDSYVNPLSSGYPSAEIKGIYATRTPTVELLGEFSIVDAVAAKAASSQTLKRNGYEESEFSKSERSRTVMIKSSPPSNKVRHSYHGAESTSLRSYTAHKMAAKKEETVQKSSAKKVVTATTSLRRSSRLQNQVTSPTP